MAITEKVCFYPNYCVLIASGIAQSDTSHEFDLSTIQAIYKTPKNNFELQIVPSATPTAGTLQPAVASIKSDTYVDTVDDISLTSSNLYATWSDTTSSKVKVTLSSFDADKTLDAHLIIRD